MVLTRLELSTIMMSSILIKLHGKTLKSQKTMIVKMMIKRKRQLRLNKIERFTSTLTGIRFKMSYKTY